MVHPSKYPLVLALSAVLPMTVAAMAGCGASSSDNPDHEPEPSVEDAPSGGHEAGLGDAAEPDGGVDEPECHFGPPGTSFTLPGPDGKKKLVYDDLQKSFPEVDWQKIDRLYIPAGNYDQISLKGLPKRPADKKLIITNKGGQVKVGPGYGCALSLLGGANWVLSGRSDVCSATGDSGFVGHAGGRYGTSRGRYGFLVDPEFRAMLSETDKITGNNGVCVAGSATDFEIEYIESQYSSYAGLMLKTDNTPSAIMRNVKVHDVYAHDCGAECLYAGNTNGNGDTQHVFENFEFYNNRFLRSGSATIQFAQQGTGLHIHHNVVGVGGTKWRWEDWQPGVQDHGMQIHIRYGSAELDHNIVLGGAHSYFTTFFGTKWSDGGPVEDPVIPNSTFTIHDNVFHSSLYDGFTLNGTGGSFNAALRVENNVLRGALDEPAYYELLGWGPSTKLITIYAAGVPVFVGGNRHQANKGVEYHSANQTNVTVATNSPETNVPPAQFVDFMGLPDDFDYATIEWWQAHVQGIESKPLIVYEPGHVVRFYQRLYRAKVRSSGKQPDTSPAEWEQLPLSTDDMRLKPGSPYQGIGLQR